MFEFKFDMDKKVTMAVQDTVQDLKKLENLIQQAEEQQERNLERYARDVTQKLIPELERQVNELDNKVQEKKYITDDLIDMDTAIKELEILNKECQELDEKAKLYNHYERTLNLGMSRFEDLEITKMDL